LDEPRFWDIIESAGRTARDDPGRQLAAVRTQLSGLSPEELVEFHRWFNRKLADAYTWDLWGAAYLINGGCSDDGFAYFRSWLISRGRSVYSGAVGDPDSLAGVVDPDRDDYEFEDLRGVAQEVYEETTGEGMAAGDFARPSEPEGDRWDFDDDEQVARRLPRLAEVYA
jgi:hypothetical protein